MNDSHQALEWIADVAAAGASATTLAAAARAVARVLAERLPLAELTLVKPGARQGRGEVARASRREGGWAVEAGPERLDATLEAAVLGGRSGWIASGSLTEARRVWVLPSGTEAALIELRSPADDPGEPTLEFEPALGRALGRALEVGAQARERLTRVAKLSQRAHQEGARLRAEVERLDRPALVAGPALRPLLRKLEAAAQTQVTILLLGESGTGKTALARRAHDSSPRAAGPFVTVDCGALPESLIESELFGHAAGAFTGAQRARAGRIARAAGGTVFLDEVGELPLAAQAKLLRVLQEGEVEPIGGSGPLRVDARFIAATNRPLETLVEEGAFRPDLYYRLSAFTLEVPPLRARPEELAQLCAVLLARGCDRLGLAPLRLRKGDLALLCERSWPGNIRQLQNVLEASAILSPGPWLDLDPDTLERGGARSSAGPERASALPETFATLVRRGLESALRACSGKVYGAGGAAERLGLHPSTLQTKLKKHGIDRRAFVD